MTPAHSRAYAVSLLTCQFTCVTIVLWLIRMHCVAAGSASTRPVITPFAAIVRRSEPLCRSRHPHNIREGHIDAQASLEAQARRLEAACEAHPGDAALEKELRQTLLVLRGPGEAADSDLADFLAVQPGLGGPPRPLRGG